MARTYPNPRPEKPPYKNANGMWLTESLFLERVKPHEARFEPLFTLITERPRFICFRTTFIELMDPTGYKWALRYLGDYEHWNRLIQTTWFAAAYDRAMNEMKIKLRSEALGTIKDIADSAPPAQALVAAKYLAGFEWEKAGRGRPSNKEITGELKRQVAALTEEDMDAERIGLKVVK